MLIVPSSPVLVLVFQYIEPISPPKTIYFSESPLLLNHVEIFVYDPWTSEVMPIQVVADSASAVIGINADNIITVNRTAKTFTPNLLFIIPIFSFQFHL